MNSNVTITRVSHTVWEFTNPDATYDIRVTIEQLVDGEYVEVAVSATLDEDESYEYTFTDGIYRVTVETAQGDGFVKPDYYTIVIYEAVMTCQLNYIKALICDADEDCTACSEDFHKKLYYYNALNATWDVFVLELNSLYVTQWGYSELTEDIITTLTDVESLITQMTNYCNCLALIEDDDCGCGCS